MVVLRFKPANPPLYFRITCSQGITGGMFGYSPRFKATEAWDYYALKTGVFSVLADLGYPPLVSDTIIEDLVESQGIPDVIGNTRFRHCISRALRSAGYVKRSERGHAWDRSFSSEWEPTMNVCQNCKNDITLWNNDAKLIFCPVCKQQGTPDCR